jgi:hypothetical protein
MNLSTAAAAAAAEHEGFSSEGQLKIHDDSRLMLLALHDIVDRNEK